MTCLYKSLQMIKFFTESCAAKAKAKPPMDKPANNAVTSTPNKLKTYKTPPITTIPFKVLIKIGSS